MRVAHVLPDMTVGGRERIVADLCRTAPAHGVTPLVVTYDPPGDAAAIDPGARIVALDRRAATFGGDLVRLLRAERIDLVHAHGHIAAALLPALPRPVVTTLHIALGSGWRWLPAIWRGLRRSAALTAVSDDLARRFAWAGRPIAVIPPGIDTARFAARSRPAEQPFTLGIVARLHPVKRHTDLLATLRLLTRQGVACRLLVAGEGPAAAAIAAAARGLDVTLLGNVDDVPALLARLDAVVLCSDHEGTPVALMEAMAAARPIVATAVGGVPALVGDAALLVPRRSPAKLAAAIAALAASPDLRHRLGHAARARIAPHDLGAQAAAYHRCYAATLEPSDRPQVSAEPDRL